MHVPYLWLVLALLSALFASLVAIFGKMGLQELDSTIATTIRSFIMFVVLLSVVFLTNKTIELFEIFKNSRALFYIFLSGLAGALSWLFYFMALKMGETSKVVPIDRLSVVFVLIFASLILGEKINLKVALGTVFVTIGAILVALG